MNELIIRLQRIADCARAQKWATEQMGEVVSDLDMERMRALDAEMDATLADLEGGFDPAAYMKELLAKKLSPEYIKELEQQAGTSGE
jgi:hypothetical protein